MDKLKTVFTCFDCKTSKIDCPYPGAFNSKAEGDGHQACDEAFTYKYEKREGLN